MNTNYWSRTLRARLGRRQVMMTAGGGLAAAAFLAACGGDDDEPSPSATATRSAGTTGATGSTGGTGATGATGSTGAASNGLISLAADTTAEAKRGGVMKDRQYADPPTLDMLTLNNPWYSTGYACYSSLVQYRPGVLEPAKLEWAPDLAESWEVSPDGLTINMKLRQAIKFHNKPPVDGRELDVDDVLFTWQRFSSEYSGRAGVVNAISPGAPVLSLTAPDPRTIQIKLAEPVYYALSLFVGSNGSGLWIIPKEASDQSKLDLRGDMLGTGPWYMDDYTPSASFTLKRHEEYWDPDYALVDQIDLPIIAEYASALSQLQAGNIYYLGSHITTGMVQQEDVLTVKEDVPELQIYAMNQSFPVDFPHVFGLLPEGGSPFVDERVRQAVSMSYNRDAYLDAVFNVAKFQAEGLPVDGRWSSTVTPNFESDWLDPRGSDFGPNAKYYEHNLEEGKRLLAAAGYPNGFDVTSNYVTGPELGRNNRTAEIRDGFAQDLGIRINTKPLDYLKEYVPQYRDAKGQFEGWSYASAAGGSILGAFGGGDLINQFSVRGGNAFRGFSVSGKNDMSGDPEVEALVDKFRLESDSEVRQSVMFDLQRYLAEKAYCLQVIGTASVFQVAWPALRNYPVWFGGRPHYRLWIDDTKAPLA